jgi:hypothetical protein
MDTSEDVPKKSVELELSEFVEVDVQNASEFAFREQMENADAFVLSDFDTLIL